MTVNISSEKVFKFWLSGTHFFISSEEKYFLMWVSNEFLKLLTDQVRYIYKDKPRAALKFRKDLLKKYKKRFETPISF